MSAGFAVSGNKGSVDITGTKDRESAHSLRFYVGDSVWDLIQKELMDWRDSSWSSMHLPEKQMRKSPLFAIAAMTTDSL